MKILLRKAVIVQLLILLSANWVNAQETIFDRLWNDPQVVDRIDRNIEQYRKGDATIEVIDKKGKHVSNVLVEVHQRTHEFLFGCNLFALGQLKTAELNSRYEAAFSNLFNFATVPFYWGDLEPLEGHPRFETGSEPIWRRPPPDQLLKWCEDHEITPKGHVLMYVKKMFMPKWTNQNDPQKLLEQGEKHMAEIAKRYSDKFPIWDVANEEMQRIRRLDEWHKVPDNYLSWCFKEAGHLFPENVKLLYNDGTNQVHDGPDEFLAIFRKLKEDKARVDGMGIQFHMYDPPAMQDGKLFPPSQLFGVYKKLEQSGLPLYITEITIAGNGENGDELQAKIVGNLYRLWFSTPNMAGITWWNLGDGTAFGKENEAKGGLLDEEMNSKPAYKVLDKLINHEWKTNLNTSSGSSGKVSFRGFYGKYKITISFKGKKIEKEINLTKAGNNKFVIQL